ncbi:hypothetical protein V5298_20085, partial [Alteromonas sp. 14N.309.X.WAT.G.H12]
MKIKFKNAVMIWSILAIALVGKDLFGQHTNHVVHTSSKGAEKAEYPFILDVQPTRAKVMIMNIAPKYKKGMLLPQGKYDIKVSLPGYKSKRVWINHTNDSPHVI